MVISSTTMAITPARHYTPTIGGYSICHHGNNICQYRLQHIMWPTIYHT